jgi:predicted HAD superfamily Cof-like phosphohydrolase
LNENKPSWYDEIDKPVEDNVLCSDVLRSNIYTMKACAPLDSRNSLPEQMYVERTPDVRLLRAKLLFEEVMEVIDALGCKVECKVDTPTCSAKDFDFYVSQHSNLEGVIDGCCDVIYVAVGTLAAHGVLDIPHLDAVCAANNAKFINGKAVISDTGKYMKPLDWLPPNHHDVIMQMHGTMYKDYMTHLEVGDGEDKKVPKM